MKPDQRGLLRWALPAFTLGLIPGILAGRACVEALLCILAAALGGIIALALWFCPGRTRMRTSAGALALGVAMGWITAHAAWHAPRPEARVWAVSGAICREVSVSPDNLVQTLLCDVTLDGQPLPRRALWTFRLEDGEALPADLRPGMKVSMYAYVDAPDAAENPGGFNLQDYLLQQGADTEISGRTKLTIVPADFSIQSAMAALRHHLTRLLCQCMGDETGSYAAAMLLGSRKLLPENDIAAFRNLGIAHILSISGYHVGVLAWLLALLLRRIALPRWGRLLMQMALLAIYCLLCGGQAPVIRAAMLCVLWEASRVRNQQGPPLHLLCLTACVQLLACPALLLSPSFQLTYSAMAGLLLVSPALLRHLPSLPARRGRLVSSACASLCAQLGILPAQLYWFCELPLLALPVNLLILPLFGALMLLYWALLATLWIPGWRDALGQIAAAATQLLQQGLSALNRTAGFTLWTRQSDALCIAGFILLLAGLSLLLHGAARRLRPHLIAAGLALSLTVLLQPGLSGTAYRMFSVGNGDAAVITDNGHVTVIDTGLSGQELALWLRQQRLPVDELILTHLHADHMGGVQALLDMGIPVAACVIPDGAELPDADAAALELLSQLRSAGVPIRYLARGDQLPLPSGSLTALWPMAGFAAPGTDANSASLVLLADLHGTRMLLPGDLPSALERYTAVPADVLHAAHHGSVGSTSADFLSQVGPSLVLLSCASATQEQSILQRVGDVPVLATSRHGMITLTFRPGSYQAAGSLPQPTGE